MIMMMNNSISLKREVSNYRTWGRERQRKGRKLNRAHMMEDEEKRMKVKRRRFEEIDKVQ